jgi:nitrogen-specific signal transduction histidine kinase/FixJ family two-component response regulator
MIDAKIPTAKTPTVLWVDDDAYILSSARRLLTLQGFNVITSENPLETLDLIEKHDVAVLISDQRMPQMTGIEVLKLAKEKYPDITRLMVTGFFDKDLLEEAINTAGVFRFINKPWTEQELVSDIKQAIEHSYQLKKYNELSVEIKNQNKTLTQLTENLESIIFERTKEINHFNNDQELKNKQIRDLVHFIQDTHQVNSLSELMNALVKDLSKFKVTPIFCYKSAHGDPRILFYRKGDWINQSMATTWVKKSEIKVNDPADQKFLADALKRPIVKIISLPLLKFKNTEELQNTLFIEHNTPDSELTSFMDYLMSRLQILSLAADRILYIEKIEHDSGQWERTFDSLQDPLSIVDTQGHKLRTNTIFKKSIKNLKSEVNLIKEVQSSKETQNEILKKDDKTYDVSVFPIKEAQFEDINHFVLYYKNITDERNLYEKMIQNEKMAALGLLAGNIAHELNNPLTGIRSFAQILKSDTTLKKEYLNDLSEIDKAAMRCQNIIQGLKEFSVSSPNATHLKKISLNDTVQKTLPFLKSAVRHHSLQLELSTANDPQKDIQVFADPQILQQIIFNLIINACQALKNPGIIKIKTNKKGDFGILVIEDDGPGIPEEIRDKIFEPFFTTKRDGEGTGLGLSFCKSMLEKMGGEIAFKTSEKGTHFKVKIPTKTVLLEVRRMK